MRTKEFTFKKTVKKSTTFNAISIDLTVEDARELLARLQRDAFNTERAPDMSDIYNTLTQSLALFLAKHEDPYFGRTRRSPESCPY